MAFACAPPCTGVSRTAPVLPADVQRVPIGSQHATANFDRPAAARSRASHASLTGHCVAMLPAKSFMGARLRRGLGSIEASLAQLRDICSQPAVESASCSAGSNAFVEELDRREASGRLTVKAAVIMKELYASYKKALASAGNTEVDAEGMLLRYVDLIEEQIKKPHVFENYHKQILAPVDYYEFANGFLRPLINRKFSFVRGQENLKQMEQWLAAGHNVILFANHQSEADPGMIALVAEGLVPESMLKDMIFIAGGRVCSDPCIVPFTLGRNCLTVISKRHQGETPEELMHAKAYNAMTMKKMGEMFAAGGKCVYVAPSGGRDRPAADNAGWKLGDPVEVAPFDPSSIELFRMVAETEGLPPCHFVPLAMDTHDLMPPPRVVESDLGEKRDVHHVPVCLNFLPEVDLGTLFADADPPLKGRALREARGKRVWELVRDAYLELKAELKAAGYVPPAEN